VVNKQYTVLPTTPASANLAISLGWITASQAAAFNPTAALVQGRFNAGVWTESAAALSGSGTVASPYYAKVSGNTSFGTFAVGNATALMDTEAPSITQPEDITVSNIPDQCAAEVSFSAQASDNFGVTSLKYFLNYQLAGQKEISSPMTFSLGSYTVTVAATDAANNTATKTFTITVKDVQKPVARCRSVVVYLDHDGNASITAAQVDDGSSDICSPVSLVVWPNSFTPANVGSNTVTLTVTDAGGNTATCQSTVTVIDNIPPDAGCKPATITLVNGVAAITAAGIDNGSSDASGIRSLQASKTSFSCADIGTNTVMLTVTDNNSNVSTCTTTVTVLGEIPSCSITSIPSNNIYTGGVPTNLYLGYGPQRTTLQVATPASGAPYTYAWTPATGLNNPSAAAPVFTPVAQGTYTFTVTATNKYGCTSTCSITICVLDIRVPGTNGKKVYLCRKSGNTGISHTLSVEVADMDELYHPDAGDRLGSCDQTPCGNPLQTGNTPVQTVVDHSFEKFTMIALSNPASGSFKLQVQTAQHDPVTISIVNVYGQVVYRRADVLPNATFSAGNALVPGVYFAEARQGNRTVVLKLIRTN
jgi:PKD repeat protein